VLDLEAGTVPDYNQGSPWLGGSDDSVQFNAGGFYEADGTSFADITTEDFVFEIVYKQGTTGTNKRIIGKRENYTSPGWFLTQTSTEGQVVFSIRDVSTTIDLTITGSLRYEWNHLIVFCDKSDIVTSIVHTCLVY